MKNVPVPLAELPVDPESAEVFADALPDYAQPDKIVVDVAAINRVAGWGGFYPDVRLQASAGPTSRQTGGFVATRNGGHRSAAISEIQPTVAFSYRTYDSQYRRRAPLTLTLNTNELTQRVQHMNGGALRKPEAWAQQINDGIAYSLRDATHRHLVSGNPSPRYEAMQSGVMLALGQAMGTFLSAQEVWADQRGVPNLIFGTLPSVMGSVIKALEAYTSNDLSFRDFSFSLCPVWQVDRMAVVSGLTRALRFAGTKPTN